MADSPASFWKYASARKFVAAIELAQLPRPPALDAPASSPLSAVDFLERVDRHLALAQHSLQKCVLGIKHAKTFSVVSIEHAKLLSLDVDHLFAGLALTRGLGPRSLVGLPKDCDHLFLTESALSHGFLASGERALLLMCLWLRLAG